MKTRCLCSLLPWVIRAFVSDPGVSYFVCVSVQFSSSVVSNSLRPHGLQHGRFPCPPTSGACSNSCPSNLWYHPTVSSSVIPFSPCLQSCPASVSFLMSQFFISGGKVLEFQLYHQSFQWISRTNFLQDWLVWSPCSPRDSQESPPAPQFESISSLALSLLHDPTLPSVHNYWKNHRFDQTDLCQQSDVSAF